MYLTFENPTYLWYLFSIPLLILTHFAFLKYNRRKALRFANFRALKRVSEEHIFTRNYSILVLRMVILACLIFAIAGTALWYKGLSSQNDFIIAIDVSSSMTARDFQPTRLDAAKAFSNKFINNIQTDSKIGVISFSGTAFIEQLPTKDRGKLLDSISSIEIADVSGTDIPGAIVTATNLLLPSKKGRGIILITDGSNTVGFFGRDPVEQGIKYARDNNIIIYTIGIGTNSGPIGYLPEYYNVSSVYDESTLFKIANETDGRYYYVANTTELQKVDDELLSKSSEAYIGVDLVPILLIAALIFVFVEWGLINTRFRAIP